MKLPARISRWLAPPMGCRIRVSNAKWNRTGHIPLTGWLFYAMTAWCTPLLFTMGLIAVAPALAMAIFGYRAGFMLIGYTASGLILAGMGLAFALRPRLIVKVETPTHAQCGQSFVMQYHVTNTGKLPAMDVTLESLLYPNPAELKLASAQLPYLAGGTNRHVSTTGKALRRGCYQLPPFRWDTRFPMGTWRCGRTDWHKQRHIAIYPHFTRLHALHIPMGARNRQETHTAQHLSRSALEFHACREFRQGDAVRHLHPRSSARRGIPIVKEFLAEGHGRTAVIVDTLAPSRRTALWQFWPDPHIEAILSLGAAVVEYLARKDHVVELLVAGPGMYRFESAGRMGFFQEVLEILAGVEPVFEDPLPRMQDTLIEEIGAIASVCLILGTWNQERAALVQHLQAMQVGVKVIFTSKRKPAPLPGIPDDTRLVQIRDVREGRITEL